MNEKTKRYMKRMLCLGLTMISVLLVNMEQVQAVEIKSFDIQNQVLKKVGLLYPSGYYLQFVEEGYQDLGGGTTV